MPARFSSGHDGRFTLNHARQQALDLLILGPRPPDPASRPHRGMLPDLPTPDRDIAPRRRAAARRLLEKVLHLLRVGAGKEAAAILMSVAAGPHVGKSAPASYMGPEDNDESRHVPLV
jgi:hypothetical protein